MDKIYIVGGGASGMMAAIQAKTKDNEVILFFVVRHPGKTFVICVNHSLKPRPGWKENSRNRKREV